jgi:ferritin-like protein
MTQSSSGYHEPVEQLPIEVMDRHRAITSLMEELEAVDWYEQRIAATSDPELAAILRHNRDEEKEHAAMVLEWLRRRDSELDQQLRTYLFADDPVVDGEGEHADGALDEMADLGVRGTNGPARGAHMRGETTT